MAARAIPPSPRPPFLTPLPFPFPPLSQPSSDIPCFRNALICTFCDRIWQPDNAALTRRAVSPFNSYARLRFKTMAGETLGLENEINGTGVSHEIFIYGVNFSSTELLNFRYYMPPPQIKILSKPVYEINRRNVVLPSIFRRKIMSLLKNKFFFPSKEFVIKIQPVKRVALESLG